MLRLPHNVGIGGAVQTGFKFALAEGYDTAVRLDGDGQHDAGELGKLLARLERGEADLVIGSRFVDPGGSYRPPFARRIGIRVFARLVSLLGGQRVTDTTSGFLALDRIGIELFAAEYPHDYPEVEATLVALKSGLRLAQVQVDMRERETGSSSITFVRSLYYIVKVMLALLVASLRRYPRLQERSPVTPLRVSLVGVVASILLILVVLELVRGRRLKERYALLWLATGVVLLVLSAWREALNTIAGWLGVTGYPPAVLFAVATLFILLVLLHYSTVLSRLRRERRTRPADRALEERVSRALREPTTARLNAKTSPCVSSSSQFVPTPMRYHAPAGPSVSRYSVSRVVAIGDRADEAVDRARAVGVLALDVRALVEPVDAVEDVAQPRPSRRPAEALTARSCARPRAPRPRRSGSG